MNDGGSHSCVCRCVYVCVSRPSVKARREVGEKSIDPQLLSDRLPLPSNGLTPWPPKVRRQGCQGCQRCALLHKSLSFFFLFYNPIGLPSDHTPPLSKREREREKKTTYVLLQIVCEAVMEVMRKLKKKSFPCSSQADKADKAGGGEAGRQTGRHSETVAINPQPSWRGVVCLLSLCSSLLLRTL